MTLQHLDTVIALAVVMLGVSLLITVLTQFISSVLGSRGTNLRWAVTALIRTVHPQFEKQATDIANKVLMHQIISDSSLPAFFGKIPMLRRWRLASAIRVEELIGIMEKLSDTTAPAAGIAPSSEQAMTQIVQAARLSLGPEIQAVSDQVSKVVDKIKTPAANPAPVPGAGAITIQVDKLLEKIPSLAESILKSDDIKSWFNSAMDRAAQRFALHMRLWTVIFAVVIAFALHLDTFRFLAQLSSDSELRASLVAGSDAMQKAAAQIIATGSKGITSERTAAKGGQPSLTKHVPDVYAFAMKKVIDKNSEEASRPVANETGLAKKTRENLAARLKALPLPKAFRSRDDAVEWLKTNMKGDDRVDNLVSDYHVTVDSLLTTEEDKLLDRATNVRGILETAKFQLIPDPYHKWDLAPWWPAEIQSWHDSSLWRWTNLHFWGVFFSAALLSLGAPFWFNALKTLSSLRPILASKQDKEQKQTAT